MPEAIRRREMMPLPDLMKRRHPKNPKGHVVPDLVASIERFGYTIPVLICERSGLIVAGHGRLKALISILNSGNEIPDGIEISDAGLLMVPVERGWSSKDDDELLAYVVADNRIPEAGGWESNLFEVLQTVSETSLGFEGIGFTELDLSQFTPLDGSSVDQRGTEPQLTDMTFQVVVDCADESEQREVIEQMEKEGRSVRALTM